MCLLGFCSALLPHHRNLEFVEDGETPARKTTLVSLLFGEGMPGHKTGWRLSARGCYSTNTPSPLPLCMEVEYSPAVNGVSSMTSSETLAEGISRDLISTCTVWLAFCSGYSP